MTDSINTAIFGHEYMTAAEVFMWGAAVGTVAANGGELFGE